MTSTDTIETRGDIGVNITSFLRHLKAENLSLGTVRTYTEAARLLAAFLFDQGMPQDVAAIRREHVETFILDQLERWSPATANNRYRGLQQFFGFLLEDGEIRVSPMVNTKPPRVPEKIVPILKEQQITELFRACRGQDYEARRDLAMIRVMVTTGVRRAELAGLRYAPDDPEQNDLDLDTGQARVMGKGRRERLVPLDPRTVKALDRYLRLRARHTYAESLSLWLGKRGRFTADGIRQMLERRAKQAGLGHVTPHQLRHSFAHAWLASGGQETDLMRLAGWRSRSMVERYAASAAQERALDASRRVGLGSRI